MDNEQLDKSCFLLCVWYKVMRIGTFTGGSPTLKLRRTKGGIIMPAHAVIGGQWGDEGKGKITDYLAQKADAVVRYAGGGNAGHTVKNKHGKFSVRIIPCGVFSPKTQLNIVGRGTVPDIGIVVGELKVLETGGIDARSLRIDIAAHLVMPWHIVEDGLEEEKRGASKLGTTGNGIGPCYADKIKRSTWLRAGNLLDFSKFKERFWEIWDEKMQYFLKNFEEHFKECGSCDICRPMREPQATFKKLEDDVEYLAQKFGTLDNLICDTPRILWDALDEGQNVLLEGAQGYLLDINHGTYPYVTSSSTGVASAVEGSGIAISDITERTAVIKAYATRVGEGAFPTRMAGYPERKIRELGQEYGTVTGRPRRCGWFDTFSFKRVARANGLTGVAITRLDILDDFSLIGIGVGGEEEHAKTEWLDGWGPEGKVKGCRSYKSLPDKAKEFCHRIACGVEEKIISTGPNRGETIVVPRNRK